MATNRPSRETPPEKLGRILIVDDETELTAALCEMLAKQGYETQGFNSGRDALAALNEKSFDVMLADLMMPEMDGITLLRSALEIDPNLTGVIMTGQGTVQTAVEAMKTGAFDYLLKPFKLNAVMAVLSRALEVRHLRMENIQMREMLNVYELGQVVSLTLDINVIFRKTSEAALQQLQADEVSILLLDEEEDELVLVATYGDHRERLIGQKIPMDGTVAGWVARHLEPITLEGELTDPRFSHSYSRPEIHSAVSMPMVSGNRLVGVVNVNKTRRRRPLTPGQILALRLLVNIAASALENARLYEQTEKRLAHLSALRTIDRAITSSLDLQTTLSVLLDEVSAQLATDAAAVLLLDPQTQILDFAAGRGFHTNLIERTHVLLGSGFAGEAALERKTIQVNDLSTAGGADPNLDAWISEEEFQTCYVTPLVAKGEVQGVLQVFHRSPFTPDNEWLEFFASLAGQAAIAIDSWRLFDHLQRTNQQLLLAYNATIEGWSAALDLRDKETEGHTRRVTEKTLRLARAMGGFDDDDLLRIRQGSLLHDIGKMGVPDGILLKPGELTEEEWKVMRKHPEYAFQLLTPITYLRKALTIPYSHHERWDGSGYPQGLKGEQIPLPARIFAVIDVYDALRSDRPYRKGWPEEEVLQHIQARSGTDFDPQVVEAFLKIAPELDQ
jgi:response regulator RpfG family c-di-GMP phosphodiesterase/putative methionine-R-sulfoxide reductase with GAF domain